MEDLLALKSMKSLTGGKPSNGGESRLLTRASSGVPEKSLIFGVLCGLELRGGMAVALNRQAISLRQANSDDMAGTINYLAPVDNASGKIFGKKEKFVAVTRNWGNRRRGCSTTGKRNLKDHPISQAEKDHQAKFAAVAAMTNARLADPNQMPLDQLAFKGQSKYKTLRQYVWHICSEEYDKQNA